MPTYEYECKACDHRFDLWQRMTDDPIKECPECGGEVRRLVSAGAGIIFKGSGFYATDYRSEGYKKRSKEESSSKDSKESKDGKKEDKKKDSSSQSSTDD